MNNRVSILIPAYNSQDFIAETLQSCIDQTYANVEIVVVDDGSKDNTLKIAKNWASRHSNIRVYSQENAGACVARNHALEKSTGDFVMFLDADNIISPRKVEQQVDTLKRMGDDMAVATCRWDRFYMSLQDAKFPQQTVYRDYEDAFDMLLDLWNHSEMFETACYLISRKLALKAGPWVPGLLKNQDGEYFSRVLIKASRVLHCPEGKLYYRTGDYDSVSKGGTKNKIEALLDSFIRYKRSSLSRENSHRVKIALARNFSTFMYQYYSEYPDLCDKARYEILDMGVRPLPSGTRRAKMISKLIGFENFLRLRSIIKHK